MSAALEQPGVTLSAAHLIGLRNEALETARDPQFAALPGGHATRRKGQGIEVADVRDYLPGDDIRHLDRATTARTGVMHIRQFQAEQDRVRLLVADFRTPMLWGVRRAFLSVTAAEVLALEGWPLAQAGGRVGLLAIGDDGVKVVAPRGRTRGMLDVIGGLVRAHETALERAMATRGAGDSQPLDRALARVRRLAPSGTDIVIASGFDVPGDELQSALDGLAQRRRVRLVQIAAPRDLPAGRYPVRLGDGRRISLRLGGAATDAKEVRIAGRRPVLVDAAATPAETARVLALSRAERER